MKIKHLPQIFFCVVFLLFNNENSAFAQRFEWVSFTSVISGNASGGSGGEAITRDDNGYLYTVSTLIDAVHAGEDTISPITPGTADIFLTKWDPQGNVIWAKVFGGNWIDRALSVSYDHSNNRIIVGSDIYGTTTFMSDTTYTNSTEYQFITFDTEGNFVSTRFVGAPNLFMAVNDSVACYLDGWSTIKEMDTNGNEKWSLSPSSSSGAAYFTNIAITGQNDVLATGIFGSSFIIGGDTVVANRTGLGDNTFLIKINQSGQVVFAKYLGVFGLTYYKSIPIAGDDSGNAYVEDIYYGSGWSFGTDTLPDATGKEGTFIAKFDGDGNAKWARNFISGSIEPYDLYVNNNEIYACGRYGGILMFGDQIVLPNSFGLGFVSKMDTSGNYLFAKEVGSNSGTSIGEALTAGDNNYVYLSGLTIVNSSNAVFGCYTQAYAGQFLTAFKDTVDIMPEITISKENSTLLATYNCICSVQWYLNDIPVENATGDELTVTENGNYYATVQDNFNCSAQSNTIDVVNTRVGELDSDPVFISPNPFTSSVQVHLGHRSYGHQVEIVIENISGQEVLIKEGRFLNNQSEINIDLSELKKGLYFLEIQSGKENIVKKILKI